MEKSKGSFQVMAEKVIKDGKKMYKILYIEGTDFIDVPRSYLYRKVGAYVVKRPARTTLFVWDDRFSSYDNNWMFGGIIGDFIEPTVLERLREILPIATAELKKCRQMQSEVESWSGIVSIAS